MRTNEINDLIKNAGLCSADQFLTVHRYDGHRLLTAFSSHPTPEPLGTWQPIEQGIVGRSVAMSEPICVSDVTEDVGYFGIYPDIRSELAIPLCIGKSIVAVVNFESSTAGAFDNWRVSTLPALVAELRSYFEIDQIQKGEELFIPSSRLTSHRSPNECYLAVEEVSHRMLQTLARSPKLLHSLTSRKFEEVVARILEDQGFTVKLTPPQNDGGFDIFAELNTTLGRFLTLVECKRYRPERPVRVDLVRNIHGVLNMNNATHAMIATTSYFTAPAKSLQQLHKFNLSLRDFNDLSQWLRRYL